MNDIGGRNIETWRMPSFLLCPGNETNTLLTNGFLSLIENIGYNNSWLAQENMDLVKEVAATQNSHAIYFIWACMVINLICVI